jgi:predicted helicase
MSIETKPIMDYINTLEKELASGNATEHTHRPALKILLETVTQASVPLKEKINATNEPQRIKCGAPDFIVTKGVVTIGYLECKDIDKSLDEAEKTGQLKRYLASLSNLILTDYLEFRWFIDGKLRIKVRLGTTSGLKIKHNAEDIQQTLDLLTAFLAHKAEGVGTARELALKMAQLAHFIRELIINTFNEEVEKGNLHAQLAAFKENLIPDLAEDQFADMYAQTIAYGLFAARCNTDNAQYFTRQNSIYLLPRTNPFLQNLFIYIAGPRLDDRIAWCVDELVQVLSQAYMEEVLKDFGKLMGKEDPVVHFYETFLKAYDPAVREIRGVYYTPEPVVSYIVRSIDYLLKNRFDKPLGLADPGTLILDPAVGTATFLYKIIDEIHHSFVIQGQQGIWNNYVAEKLLPRLFGFELLMAPYAIAHFKLALELRESGYKFDKDQRLGIYLTNTLEEGFKKAEQLAGFNEYIVEEANAAAEIKKEKPIMVVLGNPPYSGVSANLSKRLIDDLKTGKPKWELTWIGKLIEGVFDKDGKEIIAGYKHVDGAPLGERNPKWLQDDYVKFIRFGQWRIDHTGKGVLGFITNHAYLDNPTFRGMRQSLLDSFTDIYILNLHGNSKKKEVAPDGSKDENVFDIQQGVSIGILVKEPDHAGPARVHYADLWGLRESKYMTLSETDLLSTNWVELNPNSPFYFFMPQDEVLRPEYEKGWKVPEIFNITSVGIVTARDKLTIHWSKTDLEETIKDFSSLSTETAREKYSLGDDARDWKVSFAQEDLKKPGGIFTPVLYRPFDIRFTYYTGHSRGFICMPRPEVMRHMLHKNLCFVCPKRVETLGSWQHVIAANGIVDHVAVSLKTIDSIFPLYFYSAENELQLQTGRRSNLNLDFIKAFSEKIGLKFIEDVKGDLEETYGPEDIFNYAYTVFHSPTYRSRYQEFLKIDFPRLPLTSDKQLFRALAEKGAELVSLHLMESSALNNLITGYPVSGSNMMEKVGYKEDEKRVYINKEQYFEGVPPEVWNFHIGGYQVCEKWLKDRKGRTLSYDDITHYQKIVVALKETIRLMAEIDKLIPRWPIE